MAKAASPSFQRQLQNSQNASIEATMCQIEKLNPKEIPIFLSHLSNAKDPENFNGYQKLSILNALVRIQGQNIIPYISPIMSVLIQALEFSHEHSTSSLHETCARLTCAIAHYGIDPLVPESEKIEIISSLGRPLSDFLMSPQKNVASVCAFCIKALVESNNWKYSSSELVNQICLKVASALEEEVDRVGTGSHLGLAISLVKQNPYVIEPYARSLLTSGLFFLTDGGPQMKVLSVEMIQSIIKCVNPRSISSEIRNVINVLENLADDSLPGVSGAVYEALETAKMVEARRSVGLENSWSPVAGLVLSSKMGNGCNYGSYGEIDSNWETISAKDTRSFKSTGGRVNGFDYAGSGSREHYPMETSHSGDIVGSGSEGWGITRCMTHDRADRCMFEKTPNHLHQQGMKPAPRPDRLVPVTYYHHLPVYQCTRCHLNAGLRISRRNSVDDLRRLYLSTPKSYSTSDQKLQSQFSLNSNFLHRQGPLVSPESAQHRGNLLHGNSSEMEQTKTGGGNLDGTHMPSCKACGEWKRREIMSRGECSFGVFNLVLGALTVMFAIIFWVWLMDDDLGCQLVPT
ncbi:hypothetical protein FCM35_KLT15892 [Carex littledalei]|uniref:ARM repeat superfamily protein n=1 Tax=Carex littledalei TaxID=544730 RepID=A0A833VJ80_9POAL|nr:hypothetical protein FCM35_KLT15892 [Carex littledalei]